MIHPPPGSHLIPGPCPLPTRPHWYAPRRQGYEEREGAGCHLGGGQRWLLGRYHAACPEVEWGAAGGGREGEAQPPDPAGQPLGGGGACVYVRDYTSLSRQVCRLKPENEGWLAHCHATMGWGFSRPGIQSSSVAVEPPAPAGGRYRTHRAEAHACVVSGMFIHSLHGTMCVGKRCNHSIIRFATLSFELHPISL
jgi:hypothetical protein